MTIVRAVVARVRWAFAPGGPVTYGEQWQILGIGLAVAVILAGPPAYLLAWLTS